MSVGPLAAPRRYRDRPMPQRLLSARAMPVATGAVVRRRRPPARRRRPRRPGAAGRAPRRTSARSGAGPALRASTRQRTSPWATAKPVFRFDGVVPTGFVEDLPADVMGPCRARARATLDGAVGRAAVDDEDLEALERVVLGERPLRGTRSMSAASFRAGMSTVTRGVVIGLRPSLPIDAADRAADDAEVEQPGPGGAGTRTRTAASPARRARRRRSRTSPGPSPVRPGRTRWRSVVERQLLASAPRRSGAAPGGGRRSTGRRAGCSPPGAARRGGCGAGAGRTA